MICGGQIANLVRLLKGRCASLYHACQLADLRSYLAVGGVPSRACLEGGGQQFTPFETDGKDHCNSVWDKVFVNMSDFGRTFANGGKGVPNPYGPILLKIRTGRLYDKIPEALLEATDVAICLRSAGAADFNREAEALKTVEEVNFLFAHAAEEGLPRSTFIKFRAKLREKYPNAADPEVSCTVSSGRLSVEHVEQALVDPYVFPRQRLLELVNAAREQSNSHFGVRERDCRGEGRAELYTEIASVLMDGVPSLSDLCRSTQLRDNLRNWCQSINEANLGWQYRRFAQYLRDGTLSPMLGFTSPGGNQTLTAGRSGQTEDEIPF